MDDLAIIVVSWNVRTLLGACLRTARADLAASGLRGTLWVVDNASHDGSAAFVAHEFPDVHLIACDDNPGFAGGNNRALRALGFGVATATPSARHVLLLNPDTETRPGALRAMVDFLDTHPRAGVAGARLIYADGSFQHGAFGYPRLAQLALDLFPLPGPEPTPLYRVLARLYETRVNGRYPRAWYAAGRPFAIGHPLGAAFMARGAAIQQAGIMDESYSLYCEEIEWALRLRAAGWRAYCVPSATIVHLVGQSTGQVRAEALIKLWTNRWRLYSTHYDALTVWCARQLVRAGLTRRQRATHDPALRAAYATILQTWGVA